MTTKVGASAVASARAMTSRFKGNDMCLFGPMAPNAPKEWVQDGQGFDMFLSSHLPIKSPMDSVGLK